MFTGIVEATAPILAKTPEGLTVQRPSAFDGIKEGSSICVSGVCLSVIAFDATSMRFDVIEETWARTKLGALKDGSRVNLEQALPAAGRFDGNIVQGHVEGVGEVVATHPHPLAPSPSGGGGTANVDNETSKKTVGANIRLFARTMRGKPTASEAILWEELRDKRLNGFVFRRQHPIGAYILDFYCHSEGIGIELDGPIHDGREHKEEDRTRSAYLLEEKGIRILRLPNEDVLDNLPKVLDHILDVLSGRAPLSLRGRGVGGRGQALDKKAAGLGEEEVEERRSILSVRLPPDLLRYVASKGAITLDGVALTVTTIEGDVCCVALIPHTLTHTTIGKLLPGDPVNIETDVLARYTERLMGSGLSARG